MRITGLILALALAGSAWLAAAEETLPIPEAVARAGLSTRNSPWEILHGIIAMGPDLTIKNGGSDVRAVDWICTAHTVRGKSTIVVTNGYPRFITTPGRALVQGHPWQFVAKLLSAGVPLSQPLVVGERTFTLGDMLSGVTKEVDPDALSLEAPAMTDYRYRAFETGWILEALVAAGREWFGDLDRVITAAVSRPIGWGACAGTHHLEALAMLQRARPSEAVAKRLEEARVLALENQSPDGAFDQHWSGMTDETLGIDYWPEHIRGIYITGHMVSWMALAAEDPVDPALWKAYEFLRRQRVTVAEARRYFGPCCHAVEALDRFRTLTSPSDPR